MEEGLGQLHAMFMAAKPLPQGPLPHLGLPTSIPTGIFTQKALSRRYGLEATHPEVAWAPPLCDQLEKLEAWAKQTLQPNRPASYTGVKHTTWLGTRACILLFLGFGYNICRPRQAGSGEPRLEWYLDLGAFANYMGFMDQKKLAGTTMRRHIATAMKVRINEGGVIT